jgi:predicted transcriptional regulator
VKVRGIRIRPEHEGIRSSLFDLEADIMQVVWQEGWAGFSVGEVHRRLEWQRVIAYTTVMTTVSRLFDKGLLERRRDGRRYLYTPVMGQDEFLRAMARDVLGSLLDATADGAEALLTEQVADADADELDRLEAMIRARRKELAG